MDLSDHKSAFPEAPDAYTELDEASMAAEVRQSDALVAWLKANGSKFPNLYFEYLAVDYRGVCTSADMKDDEIMLEVSPDCLMTIEVAKASPIGQEIINSGCRLRSTHSYVACFILCERERGEESFWHPYINIMPKSYRMMPVFFTSEEMEELHGSLTKDEIEYRKDSYTTEYKQICQHIPHFSRFSLSDFFWARLVVLTRIFGITINGKKTSSMVPMADMLNHKRPPETYWTFDDDRNAFTITATKDFKAGEVVYDSYGRKCNTEFFMNYGFVAKDNMYNECQMLFTMPSEDPLYQQKLRLLGRDKRKLQFSCDYENETAQEAFSFLRLVVANEAELQKLTGGSAYYRPNTKRIRPFNIRNEVEAIKMMAEACQTTLNRFRTTLEQDEKILADATVSRNVLNCVDVRRCEKEVAHHYLFFATVLLPLLDGKTTNGDVQLAIKNCSAIQSNKHFRHYCNTCIVPLLEVCVESDTIETMIARFANMSVEPVRPYFDDSEDVDEIDADIDSVE